MSAIAEVRRFLDQGRCGDEPFWLDFWGPADLAEYEIMVALATGQETLAEAAARRALASVDAEAFSRNHVSYAAYLGLILIRRGQLDEAIAVTSMPCNGRYGARFRPHPRPPEPHGGHAGTAELPTGASVRHRCTSSSPGVTMTSGASSSRGVDYPTLTVYGADTSAEMLCTVGQLYAEIYAEYPYNEGLVVVRDFTAGWPQQIGQPNFRLVVARRADEPIGFAFGYQLRVQTKWWGRCHNTAT